MDYYVGTSGWSYAWNPKRSLDWFIENTGLTAVELNASFYHFPSPTSIQTWSQKGEGLRWAIKVNRLFTHTYRFNQNALDRWRDFYRLFAPLDALVDFYLFQMPPSITPTAAPLIERFAKQTNLKGRFTLEFRNPEWFKKEWINWAIDSGITLVSVDTPDLPRYVFNTSDLVYVRMHGRNAWYAHQYSDDELQEVASKISRINPEKAYIFFNNDHAMPKNARSMLQILNKREHKKKAIAPAELF